MCTAGRALSCLDLPGITLSDGSDVDVAPDREPPKERHQGLVLCCIVTRHHERNKNVTTLAVQKIGLGV